MTVLYRNLCYSEGCYNEVDLYVFLQRNGQIYLIKEYPPFLALALTHIYLLMVIYEPPFEKTCHGGFQPGLTQTSCTSTEDG